jgi:putative restriction endonuclease
MAILSHYTAKFQHLHRASHPTLGRAPHKPILLLTILDMLDQGLLSDNLVRITPELVAAFRLRWRSLVPPNTRQERIVLPFRYLAFDGFWHLVKNGIVVPPARLGDSPSLIQLTNEVDGGKLSDDLWEIAQHAEVRAVLRQLLLETYFHDAAPTVAQVSVADAMTLEAERLIGEAQAKFRLRKPRSDAQVRRAVYPPCFISESCQIYL